MSYLTEAVREYARNHGSERPEAPWILSPFDTWEPNPFFVGRRPPHPEAACWEDPDFEWVEEDCADAEHDGADRACWEDPSDDIPF